MHLNCVSYALFTVSWSRGIAFASGEGALRFKSWAGQSHTVLPMAYHHCNISSKGVVLLGRNNVEMGSSNSLHASMYCSKCNKKFDLISFISIPVAAFTFFVIFLELNKFDVM